MNESDNDSYAQDDALSPDSTTLDRLLGRVVDRVDTLADWQQLDRYGHENVDLWTALAERLRDDAHVRAAMSDSGSDTAAAREALLFRAHPRHRISTPTAAWLQRIAAAVLAVAALAFSWATWRSDDANPTTTTDRAQTDRDPATPNGRAAGNPTSEDDRSAPRRAVDPFAQLAQPDRKQHAAGAPNRDTASPPGNPNQHSDPNQHGNPNQRGNPNQHGNSQRDDPPPAAATLFARYLEVRASADELVEQLPNVTLTAKETDDGRLEVIYLRRVVERTVVDHVWSVAVDEFGQPVAVPAPAREGVTVASF